MKKTTSEQLAPPENSENRRELARDRTEWALQRTLFARERTFSAWLRTALATVAAGLAIAKLIQHPDLPLFTPILGAMFIVAGVAIFAIAFWRYWDGYRELKEEGARVFPILGMGLLVLVLILGSLAALVLVFSLE